MTDRNTILLTHHRYEYVIMFVRHKYDDVREMFRELLHELDLIHDRYHCLLKNAKMKVLSKKNDLKNSLFFLTELVGVSNGLISKSR